MQLLLDMCGSDAVRPDIDLLGNFQAAESAFEEVIADIMESNYYTESGEEAGFFNKLINGFRTFVTNIKDKVRDVFSRFRKKMPKENITKLEKAIGIVVVHNYVTPIEFQVLADKTDRIMNNANAKIAQGRITDVKTFADRLIASLEKIQKDLKSLGKDRKVYANQALNHDRDVLLAMENLYSMTEKTIKAEKSIYQKNKGIFTQKELEMFREMKRVYTVYLRVHQAFIRRLNQNAAEVIKAINRADKEKK